LDEPEEQKDKEFTLVHRIFPKDAVIVRQVAFHPSVQFVRKTAGRRRPTMAPEIRTEIFKEFESKDVTDDMLAEAARLFSEYYSIWTHLTAAREASEAS